MIPQADTTVPPDINATARRHQHRSAGGARRTISKPSSTSRYTAVGGLGPELSRIVKGSTDLAIEARKNLDPLIALIDQSQPVLEFADRHLGFDSGLGVAPGDRHQRIADPRPAPSAA